MRKKVEDKTLQEINIPNSDKEFRELIKKITKDELRKLKKEAEIIKYIYTRYIERTKKPRRNLKDQSCSVKYMTIMVI